MRFPAGSLPDTWLDKSSSVLSMHSLSISGFENLHLVTASIFGAPHQTVTYLDTPCYRPSLRPQSDYVARTPISIEGATDVSTIKNQATTGKRLLTIKELVAHLGATEWFWRSQIWSGQLPFVQVGRKMFIDREDIESFIARNKTRHLA